MKPLLFSACADLPNGLGLACVGRMVEPKGPRCHLLVWAVCCAAGTWRPKTAAFLADLRFEAPASLALTAGGCAGVSRFHEELNPELD